MTNGRKAELLRAVAACLEPVPEIRKLIAFESFLTSESPRDLDIAVVQDSEEGYLPLAMKYRRIVFADDRFQHLAAARQAFGVGR